MDSNQGSGLGGSHSCHACQTSCAVAAAAVEVVEDGVCLHDRAGLVDCAGSDAVDEDDGVGSNADCVAGDGDDAAVLKLRCMKGEEVYH